MPAAPTMEAPPTWEELSADPRYGSLTGGERMQVLDQWHSDVKQHLGDQYDATTAEPYLNEQRAKIASEGQGTISTALRSGVAGMESVALGAVQGFGGAMQDAGDAIDQFTGLPIGQVITDNLPGGLFAKQAAPIAKDLQAEVERVYAPDRALNPNAALVGGGVGQAIGMIPAALTGGTGAVLGLGAGQGYAQGRDTAEEIGVQNPLGKMALGTAFGAAETLTERLGGLGSGPLKEAAGQMINRMAGKTAKTILSEMVEEPITGTIQDTLTAGAAKLVEDPNRPGFTTTTGAEIGSYLPTNAEWWKRRGQEAIGGAAGGTVFAGLAKLAGRAPINDTGATGPLPPPLPQPSAGPSSALRPNDSSAINTTLPTGMEGASDEDFLAIDQQFASVNEAPEAPRGSPPLEGPARNEPAMPADTSVQDTGLVAGSTPATGASFEDYENQQIEKANREAALLALAADSKTAVITTDGNGVTLQMGDRQSHPTRSGVLTATVADHQLTSEERREAKRLAQEDSLAETPEERTDVRERTRALVKKVFGRVFGDTENISGSTPATGDTLPIPSIDNIGAKFQMPETRSVPVIPDSPLGYQDSLDFLNDMPIAIGRSDTGGELDWQETANVPKYYRPFITNEQGSPIDVVAQAAYEANLIPQPTADALMTRVQQDISDRRTYRVQGREQQRDMLRRERETVNFDKSQNKLQRSPTAKPVPLDALVPGDRMTIDGEDVVVQSVESDQDGYPTKVVLEDGKKFGVQEFDPQSRAGVFVDEFRPRERAETSEGPFTQSAPMSAAAAAAKAAYAARQAGPTRISTSPTPTPPPVVPPVPITGKVSTVMLGHHPKLEGIVQDAVKVLQRLWRVALPANTRTMMFSPYQASDRVNGDIDPATMEIRIRSQQDPLATRGAVYHEMGHAFHFVANRLLGRNTHDTRILQPLLNFLETTKSGQTLAVAAANVQTKIDKRLQTIAKAEAALARWKADSRSISLKGPAPKVPAAVKLNEREEFLQYLAKPSEQFARAVHAATLMLNGERLNAHADSGWEAVMAFDLEETQAIVQYVSAILSQHLPVHSGGLSVPGQTEQRTGDAADVGGGNAGAGQAPQDRSGPPPRRSTQDASLAAPPPLTPSQAVPLLEEFGGEFPGHVAFTDKAMLEWAVQTTAGQSAEQIETDAASGRYTPVQLTYILSQGLIKANAETQAAKTQAERTRAQAAMGRLRDLLNPQNAAAGQALVAQKLALASMREMVPSLAVDEAVEKGQKRVIDAAVPVLPTVQGLGELTTQASAEATGTLADALDGEMGTEPIDSTPQDQAAGDAMQAELTRLRQEVTAGKNLLSSTTAIWQRVLETFKNAGNRKGALIKGLKDRVEAIRAARANTTAANKLQSLGAPQQGVTQPTLPATAAEDGFMAIVEVGLDIDAWKAAMTKTLGSQFAPQLDSLYLQSLKQFEQELKVVDAASVKATAAKSKTKRTPQQRKATALTEEQKAKRVADGILTKIAETHSDPPIWKRPQAENPIRKLYREHVKAMADLALKGERGSPGWQQAQASEQAAFAQGLQALKVPAALSTTLAQAANLEINARAEIARAELAMKLREELERLLKDSPALEKMINQLRESITGGLSWKQIFTSTATDQRKWEMDTYSQIRTNPQLQGLTADEARTLTRELSKAWQRQRRTVWKRELDRTLIKAGMAKPKLRAKIVASAPRLLALINLGALDARTFRDAVAKEFGLRSMNDAEVIKVREAAEKLQGLATGTVPHRKAAQRFIEGMESLTGLSKMQVLESWWTASVLSGWRTQMDILLGVANAMEDVGFGSVVTALRTGNYGAASRAIFASLERAATAVPEALHMVLTGNRALQASFDAEIRANLEDGHTTMGHAGRALLSKGGWRKAPGAFLVGMGRIMSALDHITSSAGYAGGLWMARANHPELYKAAASITAKDRATARAQALQVLTGGSEPTTLGERLEVKRYTQELLDARHTPPEIEQQAKDVGLNAALQGDPTGIGWVVYKILNAVPTTMAQLPDAAEKRKWSPTAVKALRGASQLSRVLFGTKFIRTVGNAMNRATSYVPGVGAINFKLGTQMGTPSGDILMAKQMVGLLVLTGLLYALRNREEDDDMGIEGGWKDLTPEQRSQLLAQGKQPYSTWYRDKLGRIVSVNYQQWSMANLLATVGYMQDQRRYKGTDVDASTIMQGLGYGLLTITDKAQLSGLGNVLGKENNRSGSDTMKGFNRWASNLAGGMIPRIAKDIDQVLDPTLTRTDAWWQAWAREVPILRTQTSGARVDIFGRTIELQRGPLSRIYQTGFVEPEYKVLAALNQRDIWISDPSAHPRKVKLTTGTRDMTSEEKDRYARKAGELTKEWLLANSQSLLKMDPEQAQDVISATTEKIRQRAVFAAVKR